MVELYSGYSVHYHHPRRHNDILKRGIFSSYPVGLFQTFWSHVLAGRPQTCLAAMRKDQTSPRTISTGGIRPMRLIEWVTVARYLMVWYGGGKATCKGSRYHPGWTVQSPFALLNQGNALNPNQLVPFDLQNGKRNGRYGVVWHRAK